MYLKGKFYNNLYNYKRKSYLSSIAYGYNDQDY